MSILFSVQGRHAPAYLDYSVGATSLEDALNAAATIAHEYACVTIHVRDGNFVFNIDYGSAVFSPVEKS